MLAGYITTDDSTVSKSGLYFTDLAGCTISLLDDLTKEDHADYTECFDYLYKKALANLKIDLQRKLAKRFHIDKKLVSRETSEDVLEYNEGPDLAGLKIITSLPKYGRLQILTLSVYAQEVSPMPEATFLIYKDNADGDLLATITKQLTAGRNTFDIYQEFEADELYIVFDTSAITLRKTKNKYYPSDSIIGDKICFNCAGSDSSVQQVNGGGINIKFVVYCSMNKVIEENIPLFQYALLYRLGVDTMKERITTQRVNQTSVLTAERAQELMAVHNEDYMAALDAATMNIKMVEDPICFMCKSTAKSSINLP